MSQQQRGQDTASAAGYIQQIGSDGVARVSSGYGPDVGSNNRFISYSKTTASTAIAVIDGTNGILWACRFAPATSTKLALVERLIIQATSTVGPSVAQETGVQVFRATAFTAIPTSGTALTMTTPQTKLRVSKAVPEMLITVENTTSELTAGTHTLDSLPLHAVTEWHLAAGATVQMPKVVLDLDLRHSPLVIAANEGLLAGPAITQANSLAQVHRFTMIWREVDSFGQ